MRFVALIAVLVAAQDAPAPLSGRELIDREIRARWQEMGLKPAPRSDDAEFVRRVTLDIIGTIPAPERVERFLADGSSDKRAKLVDELIAHPAFADNWGRAFAQAVVGSEADRADGAVIAVARDFAALLRESGSLDALARAIVSNTGRSDAQGKDRMAMMDTEVGEGFPVFYFATQRNAGRDFPLILANKFSKVFLGTQISCAQCHDHPFDKWTQEDFYGMAAFFTDVQVQRLKGEKGMENGYEVSDRPARMGGKGDKRGKGGAQLTLPGTKTPVSPSWLGTREKPAAGATLRAEFARMLTDKGNAQFARAGANRVWAHFFGRGIVNPPDDFNARNKASHPQLLDALAADFAAHAYDIKWLVREIANSSAYQLSSRLRERTPDAEKYAAVSAVRALPPETIVSALVAATRTDPSSVDARTLANVVRQFRSAFGDDEGNEIQDFEGSVTQALLMLNGDIVARATGSVGAGKTPQGRKPQGDKGRPKLRRDPGTRLGAILEQHPAADARVRAIFLAVLSRTPTSREMSRYVAHVRQAGDEGFEDVMWTLLNSSEFLFQH